MAAYEIPTTLNSGISRYKDFKDNEHTVFHSVIDNKDKTKVLDELFNVFSYKRKI